MAVRVRIIAALDVNRRLEQAHQRTGCWLGEDGEVIDTAERGQDSGTLLLWYQWSTRTFERANASVVVEAQDQKIALCPGFMEIAYMAKVQQIKAAIGEDSTRSRLLSAFVLPGKLVTGQDLALCIVQLFVHAMTLINSSGV